jgi:hypothetical protein
MIPLTIETASGRRPVDLSDYLDASAEERAQAQTYAWIKALRHARIGSETFRTAFELRGDSLWWFAELYLHKTRVVLRLHRLLQALEALVERERPRSLATTDRALGAVTAQFAASRGVAFERTATARPPAIALGWIEARSAAFAAAARLSRLRRQRPRARPASVAAFVHTAFWRPAAGGEAYIGQVLGEIEARVGAGQVRSVGVGPSRNFRARRWWDPFLRASVARRVVPIEAYSTVDNLRASSGVWKDRHRNRARMETSRDIRAHAVIRGQDCWPIIRRELAGIAQLQFPWSARAMDEAGAALDAIGPAVAVTYAEAGGWGRAIALECRRRGIPLAGVQHGFIYRHWLNYRHEPDEMGPDAANPADRGFPLPALTLVFDRFAAAHLEQAGRFPADRVRIVGSPARDDLVRAAAAMTPDARAEARRTAGARDDQHLVLVATKYAEAARVLPFLMEAAGMLPSMHLAIKTHPAETPSLYDRVATGAPVTVLPTGAPLAPLLAAARAVVTVNSTVAIDALHVGAPSVVLGLPNNLTPFVDAGAMLGASDALSIAAALRTLVDDEAVRQRLVAAGRALTASGAAGTAAPASASAILALAQSGPSRRDEAGANASNVVK